VIKYGNKSGAKSRTILGINLWYKLGIWKILDKVLDVFGKLCYFCLMNIPEKVGDQVCNQVWHQVWNQISNQINNQVSNQVSNRVGNQIRYQVRNQIWNYLENPR
jgi:hypothetical protein